MHPRRRRSTSFAVTPLGIGTSPLAGMPGTYGYSTGEAAAVATVEGVLASPVNLLDTSNGDGEDGAGEKRVGAAIARAGGLPDGFVLATKVDTAPSMGDFSAAPV